MTPVIDYSRAARLKLGNNPQLVSYS